MQREPFSLDNLRLLDFGKIGAAFDAELAHVVKDCQERPMDDGSRTISITFTLAPVPEMNGNHAACDSVNVACDITSKLPKRKTRVYNMKPSGNSLAFNPDIPENADQEGMFDHDTGELKPKKMSIAAQG